MALDRNSYLPAFFTQSRLDWYGELSTRFSLWSSAEASEDALNEIGAYVAMDVLGIAHSEGRPESRSILLVDSESQKGVRKAVMPMAHETLYLTGDILGRGFVLSPGWKTWMARMQSLVEERYHAPEWLSDKHVEALLPRDHEAIGLRITALRRRALAERDPVVGEFLRDAWIRLGVLIGVIPNLSDQVPDTRDEDLAGLATEGEALVAAIAEYDHTNDYSDVLSLLLGSEAQQRQEAFLRGAGNRRPSTSWVVDHDVSRSCEEWCYRLRFPNLTRAELAECRGRLQKSSHPSRQAKTARLLLKARLERMGWAISEGRLRERVAAGQK